VQEGGKIRRVEEIHDKDNDCFQADELENDQEEEEKVNFEWLHLSDGEDDDYEVDPNNIDETVGEITTDSGETTKVAPRYYDWKKVFPELKIIEDNFKVIQRELVTLMESREWTPWPEERLYNGPQQSGQWKVIPLLYTFPAYDESSSKWITSNNKLCPKTTELLKKIPNIRTALFSRLGGTTRLSQHQGWADLANYVLRCHLPLIVPQPEANLCGMWVEGHVQYHKPGKLLVFDDSKHHKAFNASDQDRMVLIFDILRPKKIPKGLATGGHTEHLDQFISSFQALQT